MASDHIDRKIFFDYFNHHSMTRHEIFEVFNLVDIDRDGVLTPSEWNNFYDIFVDDFQNNCNRNGDW